MFERFTERARRVIILAREEAGRFRHDFVGTEHILLGLIRDGEGIATAVLQRLGLRLETIAALTTSPETAVTEATLPVGSAFAARTAAAWTCGTTAAAPPSWVLTTIENEPSGFCPK